MSIYWKLIMFVPYILVLFLLSRKAYGYIDPGTTSSIFAILAPLLSILLVFLGFLIRPFRRVFRFIMDKFKGSPKSETDEQLALYRLSHHREEGEDT